MAAYKSHKLVRWDESRSNIITKYLQLALGLWRIGDTGNLLAHDIFALWSYTRILAHNLQLADIEQPSSRVELIDDTIRHLKRLKKQDLGAFRRALASRVYRFGRRRPKDYVVLFLFQLAPTARPPLRRFSIYGVTFRFVSWQYFKKNFEYDRLQQESSYHLKHYLNSLSIERYFIPVLTVVSGRSSKDAFEQANKAFDLLRVAFNLPLQFRRYNEQWGGYPRPLGKFLPPPIHAVFDSNGAFLRWLYTVDRLEYADNSITAEEVRYARQMARLISVPKQGQEVSAIVIDALEKYQNALDSPDRSQIFLSLWQILESLTLQTERIDMRDVVNRIDHLIGGKDGHIRELLDALRNTRNQLVHKGEFGHEKGLEEVGLLKSVVEQALEALLSHKTHLTTRAELATYYESVGKGSADLEARRRVTSYILRGRKY